MATDFRGQDSAEWGVKIDLSLRLQVAVLVSERASWGGFLDDPKTGEVGVGLSFCSPEKGSLKQGTFFGGLTSEPQKGWWFR